MKTLRYVSTTALLAGTLLFASSCEKANVTPELAASVSQDAAQKERGIEMRITGTYSANSTQPGEQFNATLRVSGFTMVGGELKAIVVFQQVGGGISRTSAASLEATQSYFVVTVNSDPYVYGNALSITDSFTFTIAQVGYTAVGFNKITLSQPAAMTLDSGTPKFKKVSSLVATCVSYYDLNTLDQYGNHTRVGASLTADGITALAGTLDAIAAIIGRF